MFLHNILQTLDVYKYVKDDQMYYVLAVGGVLRVSIELYLTMFIQTEG